MTPRTHIFLLAGAIWAATAQAANVDLVTIPDRQSVQLTIYNSEDITLVKETRFLTFKKGLNRMQLAWTNTLIDPTSIELIPLEQKDKIEVVSTIFPGQKPQHLIWNVKSEFDGMAKIEVSYFISGLTWQMDYAAVANPDETALRFRGFVRVANNSGEEFENAEVRLIVGTINLVEKIAELARQYGIQPPAPKDEAYGELKRDAVKASFSRAAGKAGGAAPGGGPKEIVKEGLSEYFMFTVPGTESIPNGWSKRMQAVDAEDVKFDIVHRVRAYQYGPWPVRFFIFTNDTDHKLGDSPLPDGLVRIFRENAREGLAYLGEQQVHYVPIKAKAEINLGPDRLVVYEKRMLAARRLDFHFRRDLQGREWVDGWNEEQSWNDEIRNYTGKPLSLELRLQYEGDATFASEAATTVFDLKTVETKLLVAPGQTRAYPYSVTFRNGVNAAQTRVKLAGQ
ncbi:MAG: hypothetical protein NTV86_13880 [Planctomycetota bacterium]|nr:hypothetical protein [Planctomycetota bacterium]